MGKINAGRVLIGGIVAGIIVAVVEWLVNGVVLLEDWTEALKLLGKSGETTTATTVIYVLWSLLVGIATVWLYAAIRPRFGAGPRTAVIAGFAMWIFAYLSFTIAAAAMALFPGRLLGITTVIGAIELVAAALVGAWLYREESAA
ncbi:MAG: hypothetical protein K6T59_04515 [Bryobacteraceae bacterium]|jgi:uncharacterized membrane protein|nr:hypothetical protein [Bryobacteraceae bacterium]